MPKSRLLLMAALTLATLPAGATILGFEANANGVDDCASGAVNGCFIAPVQAPLPDPVEPDPDDGTLIVWDELQNVTLTQDLRVDRVADPTADFIQQIGSDYLIAAGTIVSSHYVQWDPGSGSEDRVDTTMVFDSNIFAFVTDDQNLFASDYLGLADLDYNDFRLRGLENGDATDFGDDLSRVDISWRASSPGDWTRVLTAFSPAALSVPAPAGLPAVFGVLAYWALQRRGSR